MPCPFLWLSYVLADWHLVRHHGWPHCTVHGHAIMTDTIRRQSHGIGSHAGHWVWHVAVLSIRRGCLFVQGSELVLLGFKVVISVVDFTVGASFVCTTMPVISMLVVYKAMVRKGRHTVQGCRSERMLCCSVDTHRVALEYVSARGVSDVLSA